MATQICPDCKTDSFTWSIDEENEKLTIWSCYNCNYIAHEDESLERDCKDCNKKSELYMKDGEKLYWWCHHFNKITPISETEK